MHDNVAYFLRLFMFFIMLLFVIIILIFGKIHKEILSKFLNLFGIHLKMLKFILLILLILVKLLLLKTKIINPFKN